MGISLLFQVFLHIWASILVTRMLGLPAGMPTPWQEAQHPSLQDALGCSILVFMNKPAYLI